MASRRALSSSARAQRPSKRRSDGRHMSVRFSPFMVVTLTLGAGSLVAACHPHETPATTETTSAAAPPANEAWVKKDQLAVAEIKEGQVEDHTPGAQIAASGRITFDDLRVSHVFSPVTGRVTKIQAQLGQRVKKGQILASIVSPDMGQASSDLTKAEADVI